MRAHITAVLLLFAPAALAQTAPTTAAGRETAPIAPSRPLAQRIETLGAIINGTADFDSYFDPSFKAQVPKARLDQITQQLRSQVGPAIGIEQITATGPWQAIVRVRFETGVGTINLVVDPTPPHRVTGLLFARVAPSDDSAARIDADFAALPGRTAFGIYALGDTLRPIAERNGATAMPLGSAFKLWVLAEAARQVNDGTRSWSDVVTIGPRSLPTGMTQRWPANAPATLHTLATLMISISDNSATDNLLTTLGRGNVDSIVARTGVTDPALTLPVLTTMEAFRLKAPGNADIAARWKAAGPNGRRKLLRDNAARIAATTIDARLFGEKPLALDVEWFASVRDEAAVLDWLRTKGGSEALAILAVNPGTPSAELFDYTGFKGGSEPGVIFASWLVRTKKGNWYAVTGGWTRPDTGVDTLAFMNLMNRILTRLATR